MAVNQSLNATWNDVITALKTKFKEIQTCSSYQKEDLKMSSNNQYCCEPPAQTVQYDVQHRLQR